MHLRTPATQQHDFKISGLQGFCVQLMMAPNVELRRTTLLREDLAGARRVTLFVRRFRREGGDDFLEARVPAQRLPVRVQTQLAIADPGRPPRNDR
jgi:hypothetical protein